MAYTNIATGAGFRHLSWSKIDDDGIPIGTGATRPTAGNLTGAGFSKLKGAITLPNETPEDEVLDVPGDDDDSLAAFNFSSGQSARGTLELSYAHMDFEAYVQSLVIENPANTDWGFIADQAIGRSTVPVQLLAQRRAIKGDPSNLGNKAWELAWFLNTKVTPRSNTFASRARNNRQYSLLASKQSSKPWGVTMTESTNDTTGGGVFRTFSDNPVAQRIYTGNGVVTAFTLPFTVLSTTGKILVAVNRVLQVIGGGNDYTVSGTTLTFAVAPANNANIQVVQEISENDLE